MSNNHHSDIILLAIFFLISGFLLLTTNQPKHSTTIHLNESSQANNNDSTIQDNISSLQDTPIHTEGSGTCQQCHFAQHSEWQNSHHDKAMATATKENILGDFNNVKFEYFGRSTTFQQQGDIFFITTENEQGNIETFEISHTLGITPLQQYLVRFDDGRIQALPFAWDTREKKQGGQRWFHLYPNENITPDNPLFWTRPLQNWNHMCADCHTTQYQKNFSPLKNQFDSHWLELGVGCESCHGAASNHIKWTKNNSIDPTGMKGFSFAFFPSLPLKNSQLKTLQPEINQCGHCHARRNRLSSAHSDMLETMLDTWQPEMLHEPLYFDDGQIRDEVFVTGSFLQSKMYQAGVKCSNCHNPHSLKLKFNGNKICTQCHTKTVYDSELHHFHKINSTGAQCVNCHMPERTYMEVDPRRDHRFSIPRPDLSIKIGTPNPCANCHIDKNATWATKTIALHFGKSNSEHPEHFASTFWQARKQLTGAEESLITLINDNQQRNIVKATALIELGQYISPSSLEVISQQLKTNDTLIRLAAIKALSSLPATQNFPLLAKHIKDKSKAIRLAIAPLLLPINQQTLTSNQQNALKKLFSEYKIWLEKDSDRSQSQVALANFYFLRGDLLNAQTHFEQALKLDSTSLTAYLNYADYYRTLNNNDVARNLLEKALEIYPDSADAHFAFGLLLVRTNNQEIALKELELAYQLNSENSHYLYVLAIAFYSQNQQQKALDLLEEGHKTFPANQEILLGLVSYLEKQSEIKKAIQYAEKLSKLASWNTEYTQQLKQLQTKEKIATNKSTNN